MNAKIERIENDILKVKEKISTYQSKLRDLEKQKTELEDQEIIALFRREKLTETEFFALLYSQRKDSTDTSVQIKEDDGNEV